MKGVKGWVMLAALAIIGTSLAACASSPEKRSAGTYLDDKTISAKVKTDLAEDPITKASEIEVTTFNGVVELSGFVSTKESIKRAEDIASHVKGVKSVENNLILRSETVPPPEQAPPTEQTP